MDFAVSSTGEVHLCDFAAARKLVSLPNTEGHMTLSQLYTALLHISPSSGSVDMLCPAAYQWVSTSIKTTTELLEWGSSIARYSLSTELGTCSFLGDTSMRLKHHLLSDLSDGVA